jgi:hypothetical protein
MRKTMATVTLLGLVWIGYLVWPVFDLLARAFFAPRNPETDSDFRLAPAVSRRATNPCFFFIHET